MRKHLLTFIFLEQSLVGVSPFTDTFSDEDFIPNLNWFNDIENSRSQNWIRLSEDRLQLNTEMCIVWMGRVVGNSNIERFKKVMVLS